jgi:hypothetical protein
MKPWRTLLPVLLKAPRVLVLIPALILLAGAPFAEAQPFGAGSILTTNLALQNRFLWTNDSGRVFTSSNSMIRLSDFEGRIVFLDFFDVW